MCVLTHAHTDAREYTHANARARTDARLPSPLRHSHTLRQGESLMFLFYKAIESTLRYQAKMEEIYKGLAKGTGRRYIIHRNERKEYTTYTLGDESLG